MITWVADVLRDAGLPVKEVFGWKKRTCGTLIPTHVVWHHDGSPPGASPNVPGYIAGQVDKKKPGANLWVALDGTWHVIAAGLTYHAGEVLPGKPGNDRSIGIETDHTTGETWSGVELLHSLRVGTAAILNHLQKPANNLEFHKTICSPIGRKTDPDGLSVTRERIEVLNLMEGDEDMAYKDWDPASKMMLAADVANVVLGALAEDEKFTAASRLRKAAARADKAASILEAGGGD